MNIRSLEKRDRRLFVAGTLLLTVVLAATGRPAAQQPPVASKLPDVRLNRTVEILQAGKPALGLITPDPSPAAARAVAGSGVDFVLLDMEHGTFDPDSLERYLFAMINKREIAEKGNLQPGVTPFVRIPTYGYESSFWAAKQVLDRGVMGIMFPAISTRQQAIDAIAAARFPEKRAADEPMGRRGSGGGPAAYLWGVPDYIARADAWPLDPKGELLLILQIETAEGVRNVNEILSVPGIGVAFVGPTDLGFSVRSETGAPELEQAIQTALKACLAKNIPCGITTGPNDVETRLKQGFKFVTVGGTGIAGGATETLRRGRAAVK